MILRLSRYDSERSGLVSPVRSSGPSGDEPPDPGEFVEVLEFEDRGELAAVLRPLGVLSGLEISDFLDTVETLEEAGARFEFSL